MAQGSAKLNKGKAASGGRKNAGKTPKGKRVVPPKDKQKIVERSAQKKLSSSINNSIEKQMISAASAGKLTIMRSQGEIERGAGKGDKKAGK